MLNAEALNFCLLDVGRWAFGVCFEDEDPVANSGCRPRRKALDPIQFANDIDNYKMLPWSASVGLALYLPWLEILCGLAVIFHFLYRGGLSILTALLAVFIGATIAAKIRGLDITCGCFGHASKNWNFSTHLLLDLLILVAALSLFSRVWRTERS